MPLRVLNRLLGELTTARPTEIVGAECPSRQDTVKSPLLAAEDELLVESLRKGLATIATTLSGDAEIPPDPSVRAALDGAEAITRGELMTRKEPRPARLLPSLVFLVALPIVEQDRALQLSLRTSQLIAEETGPDTR